MELGLSLGEAPPAKPLSAPWKCGDCSNGWLRLKFSISTGERDAEDVTEGRSSSKELRGSPEEWREEYGAGRSPADPPTQLELLPSTPVLHHLAPPLSSNLDFPCRSPVIGCSAWSNRRLQDVKQIPSPAKMEATPASSPPNCAVSSIRVDFATALGGSWTAHNDFGEAAERAPLIRASEEEESGRMRKKLRLSREQSAYLEESFKEHNTLNPKQKVALARQLNLRPRQVEVWFQNRRARTKLKQTEVDCEYLKSCCEKLAEDNRRLHKELQELRALKTPNPFSMHLPATTLTMCPSCERVATAAAAASAPAPSAGLPEDPAPCPSSAVSPVSTPSSVAPSSVIAARHRLFPYPSTAAVPQIPPRGAHSAVFLI